MAPFVHTLLISFIFLAYTADAQVWNVDQKLSPDEWNYRDQFSQNLAVNDQFLFAASNTKWFISSGINNDTLGAVCIFKFDSTQNQWKFLQYLRPSSGSNSYGCSIACTDSTLVVGDTSDIIHNGKNYRNAGCIYVYRLIPDGVWIEVGRYTASKPKEKGVFGTAVQVSERTIVVGSPGDPTDHNDSNWFQEAGAVYIFQKQTGGQWKELGKLCDNLRRTSERFGASISLRSEWLAIGVPGEDYNENEKFPVDQAGAVCMYRQDIDGFFYFRQKILDDLRLLRHNFGLVTSLGPLGLLCQGKNPTNSTLLLRDFGTTWQIVDRINFSNGSSPQIGTILGQSENFVAIAEPQKVNTAPTDPFQNTTGQVHIFENNSGVLTHHYTIRCPYNHLNDFGKSFILKDSLLIVGAYKDRYNEDSTFTQIQGGSILVYSPKPCVTKYDTIKDENCYVIYSPSGKPITESRHFTDTVILDGGCLKLVDTEFKIHQKTYHTIDTISCVPYTTPSGSEIVARSTIIFDLLVNSNGCDSVIRINLTYNHPNTDVVLHESKGELQSLEFESVYYHWFDCFNREVILEDSSRKFAPLEEGLYAVALKKGDCLDTSTCRFINRSQLIFPYWDTIRVYPNPSYGKTYLDLGQRYDEVEIWLSDNKGRTIEHGIYRNIYTLDFTLPVESGMYILRVKPKNQGIKYFKVMNVGRGG
ncbi:hypothetical protein GYB22_05740 [bacterium]|nr:hypothetical protein [bacterium]